VCLRYLEQEGNVVYRADDLAHTPHPQADAYADPEYTWDDYIQL